jgi:hypothetical protein
LVFALRVLLAFAFFVELVVITSPGTGDLSQDFAL